MIGEAKAGRKAFDGKDRDSRGAKGRPQFAFADARRYFLLGDAAAPDDWAERGNGRLTWAGLAALQATLCDALPEPPEGRALVADLIAAQFAAHGIAPAAGTAAPSVDALRDRVAAADGGWSTPRCGRFAAMAVRHLGHLAGRPAPPPPGYLAAEPAAADIVPGWAPGFGGLAVNTVAFWRLPDRPGA